MYICEHPECRKQFRDGEGLEHEDDNGLFFFCSLKHFKEWYESIDKE